jgi:pimeloyl-ACP methyl ester carboxylesterase
VGVAVFLIGFNCAPMAASLPAIGGDWVGVLPAGNHTLHLVLHVWDANGKLAVRLDSPDWGGGALRGSNVLFDGSNFSFDVHYVHGSYRGTLSGDGRRLVGAWIQTGSVPLNFTRRLLPPIVTRNAAVLVVLLTALVLWRRFGDKIAPGIPRWRWTPVVVAIAPLALAGALLTGGYFYEKTSETIDVKLYPPPGKLVDVGGHRLHLYCKGTGTPTVIIETGIATPSLAWFPVQNGVARFTRVCTYDRAGLGWSDPAPLPLSMADRVRDLHTLLSRAGVTGPFLFVGHSYGGLLIRMFARKYPDQVAGMVLVDSVDGRLWQTPVMVDAHRRRLKLLEGRELDARFGLVRFELRRQAVAAAIFGQPEYWTAASDEVRLAISPNGMEDPETPGEFDHLPLIVIRRGESMDESGPGMSAEQFERQWKQAQERLARLSANSELIVAEDSDHDIQIEQPQIIVDEIDRLVAAIRQHMPVRESVGTADP